MRFFTTLCSLLILTNTIAQNNNNQENIANYVQNYFKYDREIIHVQFNKNIYINNEDIAFKGYVYSKNNKAPHLYTTNVQLVVYNDNQEIILKQLLYTTKGIFSGGINLSEKFKSGKYYFRFYTNWMSNFKENDTFTQTIEIVDKNEEYRLNATEPNWKTAQVVFFPEGGKIIDGISNKVGVKIFDCNQKGIEMSNIAILDSKSNEVALFKTNKMGNGAFYFIPKLNEKYTLKINSKELTLSQPLPIVYETGVILSYNNNLNNNKFVVAIRTNNKGADLYQNQSYTLLIQQDGNLIQAPIAFKNKELDKELLFDKKYLSNGVNSIRLIDENLNEIDERLIYQYDTERPLTTLEAKVIANDNIQLTGKTEVTNANLSISVLPEETVCINKKRTIQGTFYLNAYLENPETDNAIYFDLENPNRQSDIDLLMLNQNHSKFRWENIKSTPPENRFSFEKGVNINGKIEREIKTNSKYKIALISLKDNVYEETSIDTNNNFEFKNFYAKDSTVFILQMVNEKGTVINTKIESRVSRNETPFTFPLLKDYSNCPIEKIEGQSFQFEKPNLEEGIIDLEGVTITNNYKKKNLVHKNEMSFTASAYKIDDNYYGTVLDFIGMHGFQVGFNQSSNSAEDEDQRNTQINEEDGIYIRGNRSAYSGKNTPPPMIYVDNSVVMDFNMLYDIGIQDVDEIYIDLSSTANTTSDRFGVIKIFMKTGRIKKEYFDQKHTSLIVTKGFSKDIEFKNTTFNTPLKFFYFGTLNWTPNISLMDNPNYEITFPKGHQKEIQVLIEGFSEEGQLISEIKTISVNP